MTPRAYVASLLAFALSGLALIAALGLSVDGFGLFGTRLIGASHFAPNLRLTVSGDRVTKGLRDFRLAGANITGKDDQRRAIDHVIDCRDFRLVCLRAPRRDDVRVEQHAGLGEELTLDAVDPDERSEPLACAVVRKLLRRREQPFRAHSGRKVERATRTPPAL